MTLGSAAECLGHRVSWWCLPRLCKTATSGQAAEAAQKNQEAAAVFGSEGAFNPDATRAALANFAPPTLLLAGELDVNTPPSRAAEFTQLFPNAELVVQPGAAHPPGSTTRIGSWQPRQPSWPATPWADGGRHHLRAELAPSASPLAGG